MGRDKPCESYPIKNTLKYKRESSGTIVANEHIISVASYPILDNENNVEQIVVYK